MSITTFDELLKKLHDHLLRQDSKMRDSITEFLLEKSAG